MIDRGGTRYWQGWCWCTILTGGVLILQYKYTHLVHMCLCLYGDYQLCVHCLLCYVMTIVCRLQQLSAPSTFESAARELLEWCSDIRAFQPHFEQALFDCLTVSITLHPLLRSSNIHPLSFSADETVLSSATADTTVVDCVRPGH